MDIVKDVINAVTTCFVAEKLVRDGSRSLEGKGSINNMEIDRFPVEAEE